MALRVEERIVAGGGEDRVLVHHLVLRGSNRGIGRHLGEIARTRYRLPPPAAADRLRARVQRAWLRANAPLHLERMHGVADAYGLDLADDAWDLSRLGVPPASPGCSAVFLPPRVTAGDRPLLSRAFDFAAPPERMPPGAPPAGSRPYVLELHPDDGLPSLALVAFDLLGGVLDGVNAEGLAVVVASDVETAERGLEPDPEAIGLDELQLGRLVLDGCASARDAREVMLAAKHAYAGYPVHWLVADRHGDAFVFELGPGRNRAFLVESAGEPLVVTNHPLHRYPSDAGLPRGDGPATTYARWRALRGALAEERGPWSATALSLAAERAFLAPGAGREERTLWHGVYDLRALALEATFFERDAPDPARGGALAARRTPPLRFQLEA